MAKKILQIDADSVLYAQAAKCQEVQCLATNKDTNKDELFDSKTHFNTWVSQQEGMTKEDFTFTPVYKQNQDKAVAFAGIRDKIALIVKSVDCSDFKVCIEGEGNYRMDYKTPYVNYKGNRPPKPLLFHECRQYLMDKYPRQLVLAHGQETDDVVNIVAWESYRIAAKSRVKDDATHITAFIDKDIIANSRGCFINYNKLNEGVFWVTEKEQTHNFWIQALMGDTVDNIKGLPSVSKEMMSKYKMSRTSCGAKGAEAILYGAKSEKEMIERVIECYKSHYDERWYQALQDNCFFLYTRRFEGELFDLGKHFESVGVKYEQ